MPILPPLAQSTQRSETKRSGSSGVRPCRFKGEQRRFAGLPPAGVVVAPTQLPHWPFGCHAGFHFPWGQRSAQSRIVPSSVPRAHSGDDIARVKATARPAVIRQTGEYESRNQSAGGAGARGRQSMTNCDIEFLEMPHRMKVGAPSAPALLLGEAAAMGRGMELAAHQLRGRAGNRRARMVPLGSASFARRHGVRRPHPDIGSPVRAH
jgi:hypothetical protein